ncbi:DUF2147 domain-containing protein [Flavobacterium sp. J27]|uniref:DUF2147 domain-containing protein n=1 Tax=Flavobacterium sp. J27 TaxID=2060419 RepID=UPI001031437D|nr:DUF2147 domain-containing protein [Flavobacterium sp. J27]
MKKNILLLFFLFLFFGHAIGQDQFVGDWQTNEGKLKVEIYKQEAYYYAKVKASENKETLGKVILIQMVKKTPTKLYGGTFLDESEGSEFEALLKLIDDNTMRLRILTGLFSKIMIWNRVGTIP